MRGKREYRETLKRDSIQIFYRPLRGNQLLLCVVVALEMSVKPYTKQYQKLYLYVRANMAGLLQTFK